MSLFFYVSRFFNKTDENYVYEYVDLYEYLPWKDSEGFIQFNLTVESMKIEMSHQYAFFMEHVELRNQLVVEIIPTIMAILVFILNMYLLACLFFVAELRKVNFLLVGWQAVCDLFSVSIGDSLSYVLGYSAWWIRVQQDYSLLRIIGEFIHCHLNGLSQIVNEYSTCFALLFFAMERFIIIVYPFTAKTLLTRNFYLISFVAIVLFDLLLWGAHILTIILDVEPCDVKMSKTSFWMTKHAKFWGDLMLFLITPASLCTVAYGAIAVKFLSIKMRHRKQKQH